jgi:hypothetical protein
MGEAVRVCRDAAGSVEEEGDGDGAARERVVAELGHTFRQFGDLVARSADADEGEEAFRPLFQEALGHLDEAVAVYGSLGEGAVDLRTGAELAAAWLELDLGERGAAGIRAGKVLEVYGEVAPEEAHGVESDTAVNRRAEARRIAELSTRTDG